MLAFYISLGIALLLFMVFIFPGFFIIGANEVGILIRKMTGKKMPDGNIIARNNEIGIQATTLMPGFYWRFPIFWSVRKARVTVVNPGEIGVLESVDGKPLPANRLLGDEIECNSFQDTRKFLENGGYKGPQIGFLRPGTYRINTLAFKVAIRPATRVEKNQIGVAIALDGIPLPSGYIIAPKSKDDKSDSFQNGQAFVASEGYRGPQLDTLQPGTYYINPLLFEVKVFDIADVPPGYVAVIRSNVGSELEDNTDTPRTSDSSQSLKQPIHEDLEKLLITDKNRRGIWRDPVAPGKYNLNPIAFTAYMVPTSAVTIDWASSGDVRPEVLGTKAESTVTIKEDRTLSDKATEFFKFSQLRVTSKDGFQLNVEVRMVIRIHPANAAFVIARFGSVSNLIEQIVHPLIDSSFRNNAGEKKAIEFVHSRSDLQKEALERAREEFEKYNVEAQNLLIAYIDVDKSLLDTQTRKEIAIQQQAQYAEEASAQEKLIAVREKSARAEKQKDVIEAKLSIDINSDKAAARIKEAEGTKQVKIIEAEGNRQATIFSAEGTRQATIYTAEGTKQATILEADGNAYKSETEGKGVAKAYDIQIKAIGKENVFMLRLMEQIAAGNIKIVPDVQVSGDNSSGIIGAALGKMLKGKATTSEDKGNTRPE